MPFSRMPLPRSAYWSSWVGELREVQNAARREHHVVVERVAETLPELQAPLVEILVLVEQVVGADDGRVAADIALADPAALEERDVRGCRAPWRDRRRSRGHGRRRRRRSRRRSGFGSALRQVGFQPLLPESPWRSTEKTEYSAMPSTKKPAPSEPGAGYRVNGLVDAFPSARLSAAKTWRGSVRQAVPQCDLDVDMLVIYIYDRSERFEGFDWDDGNSRRSG